MGQHEEGYVKFQAYWQKQAPLPWHQLQELNACRQLLYQAGLIGVNADGIGYGNLSQRWQNTNQFIITGSATGHLPQLSPQHYALVKQVDLAANRLWCEGPIIASSESMSHAAIFLTCPWVEAVAHVHHLGLWQSLLHRYPSTAQEAAYGTPEMAFSIIQLLRETDLPERKLLVMQGHYEGLIAFGSLAEVASILISKCTGVPE